MLFMVELIYLFSFFQAEDGIRDGHVTGVQTCALPISPPDVRHRTAVRGEERGDVAPDIVAHQVWDLGAEDHPQATGPHLPPHRVLGARVDSAGRVDDPGADLAVPPLPVAGPRVAAPHRDQGRGSVAEQPARHDRTST